MLKQLDKHYINNDVQSAGLHILKFKEALLVMIRGDIKSFTLNHNSRVEIPVICFGAQCPGNIIAILYYQYANRFEVFIYFYTALNIEVSISSETSSVPNNSTSVVILRFVTWLIDVTVLSRM